jgi:23S rRNA U2552 (ribose-2'-O)-methylase RlmE/FtsJ
MVNFNLKWALEVEVTHINRLVDIIKLCHRLSAPVSGDGLDNADAGSSDETIYVQHNHQGLTSGVSSLIFLDQNIVTHPNFPFECLKYISRVFYLPFTCHQPEWLICHQSLRNLICTEDVILKLSCSPKELEPLLGEGLYDNLIGCSRNTHKFDLHPSKHTHMMMCLYDPVESVFRWGLMSRASVEENIMTTEQLTRVINEKRASAYSTLTVEPVCRAYFKLDEILAVWLPAWGWKMPSGRAGEEGIAAIDVGASPGGWTQRLASHCTAVLAVDPGLLRPEILSLRNVVYLQHLAQAEEVGNALKSIQHESVDRISSASGTVSVPGNVVAMANAKIRFVVCDINCDAKMTADCLVSSVLPYIEGYGCCCCGEKTKFRRQDHCEDDTSVVLVVTLKLFKNPKSSIICRAVRDVVQTIGCQFASLECENGCKWVWDWATVSDCRVIHLCSNSANERTVVLRRRCVLGNS